MPLSPCHDPYPAQSQNADLPLTYSIPNNKPYPLNEQIALKHVGFGLSPCSSTSPLPCSYATFYSNVHDFQNMFQFQSQQYYLKLNRHILFDQRWCHKHDTKECMYPPICRTDFKLYIWACLIHLFLHQVNGRLSSCSYNNTLVVWLERLTSSSNPLLQSTIYSELSTSKSYWQLPEYFVKYPDCHTMHYIIQFKILPFLQCRQFPQHYG